VNGLIQDIDRLIFVYLTHPVSDRYFGSAANNNPMLGTMTMLLQ